MAFASVWTPRTLEGLPLVELHEARGALQQVLGEALEGKEGLCAPITTVFRGRWAAGAGHVGRTRGGGRRRSGHPGAGIAAGAGRVSGTQVAGQKHFFGWLLEALIRQS